MPIVKRVATEPHVDGQYVEIFVSNAERAAGRYDDLHGEIAYAVKTVLDSPEALELRWGNA